MPNNLTKNFVTLLGGSILGQIINVLVSPILTRIFSPNDFGYFGAFSAFISILSSVTTLKLEMALPIKSEKEGYVRLFWVIIIVNLILSLLFGIIFYFIPLEYYKAVNLESLYGFLWLLPISLICTGVNRVLNSAVVRFKAFKEISISFLNQIVVKNVFQIGVGYFYPSGLVLILGIIINQITALFNLIRVLRKQEIFKKIKLTYKDFIAELREHKHYIIYGTPSGLANTLGLYLPVPLMMFFFGAATAGSLSFGITLISLPMRVIGMSLSQVFIGEASDLIRNDEKGLDKLYDKILKKLIYVTVIPVILVACFGGMIFPFVFGDKWVEAGNFIRILSLCYGLQFISSPLSQILNLLVLQKVQLQWDIFRLIITVVTLVLPYYMFKDATYSILFFSIGMSICYIALILLCRRSIKKREERLI